MAATTVTPSPAEPTSSLALSFTSVASGGDLVANTPKRTIILVRNTHVSDPRTVTIHAQKTEAPARGEYPSLPVPDVERDIEAGETHAFGPFRQAYQNTDGQVSLTYSDSGADLEITAINLPA